MNLSVEQSHDRLVTSDHGVLATLHPTRGADLVPVVYAAVDGYVGVPIDVVKSKSTTRLQRVRNLERDDRATLLVEHWDPDDWSALWWVRVGLRWLGHDRSGSDVGRELSDRLSDELSARHVQYRDRPFAEILVFAVDDIVGWAAGA